MARKALLQKGWTRGIRIGIDARPAGGLDLGVAPVSPVCIAGRNMPGQRKAHNRALQRGSGG